MIFMHGEPTWSFLWRKVIPPVRDAGFRCIAPDYAGFGRSDKPTDIGWYSYDRHVELAAKLLEELDVRGATMVVHDWGGPIGLRLAVEHPERIDRLVITDSGIFTGNQRMSEAWLAFRDFTARTEDLPVGMLVRGACKNDPGEEVIAAYEAPYPNAAVEGRRARLPGADPVRARRPRRGGGPAHAARAARGHPPDADPVGRLRPGAADVGGGELRRRDRQAAAARDRGRGALPAGGQRPGDRRDRRGVAYRVGPPPPPHSREGHRGVAQLEDCSVIRGCSGAEASAGSERAARNS